MHRVGQPGVPNLKFKSPIQAEYGRMAAKAKHRRDKCVICGWEGECFRHREGGQRQSNGLKIPRVCPNCWQAVRNRGDFNQVQVEGVDQAAYRYQAQQRLADAADRKTEEGD